MKQRSFQDEQRFLSRFDAFWATLKQLEATHEALSLDPRQRYWIDTYPPLMPEGEKRPIAPTPPPDLEAIAAECQEELYSLYFHIPFCRRRCAFCRQYEISVADQARGPDLMRTYVDRLKQDINASLDLFPALKRRTRAVYFGGGTPSLLPPSLLGELLEHLLRQIDLSVLSEHSTYEFNPEDEPGVTLEMLKAAGIPRVSIGVQSFDARILRAVGRRYSREDVFRLVERAAQQGFQTINLDLIDGFPLHREFGNWKREIESLESLFASGAIHSVTLYPLHPFPGTCLPCDPEDARWQMRNMHYARECLGARLRLHERPIYWFQREPVEPEDVFAPAFCIFGYGNSSYSSLGRWLLQNETSLKAYLEYPRNGQRTSLLPVRHGLHLSPRQIQVRSILFSIRNGSFRLRPNARNQMDPAFSKQFEDFVRDGLMECADDLYRLTAAGKVFAHQMPFCFFDTPTRQDLRRFLETRFRAPLSEASTVGDEG